jgi:hypothetical protein
MFMVIRRVVTASANNIGTRQLIAKMGKEILLRFWRMYRKDALGRLSIPAQDKTRRPV